MVVIQHLTGSFYSSKSNSVHIMDSAVVILFPNSLFHVHSTFMISALTGDGVDALQDYLLDQVCLSTHRLN